MFCPTLIIYSESNIASTPGSFWLFVPWIACGFCIVTFDANMLKNLLKSDCSTYCPKKLVVACVLLDKLPLPYWSLNWYTWRNIVGVILTGCGGIGFGFGSSVGLLGFESLTRCPINKQLIDKALLTSTEISWLNNYHQLVLEELSPLIKDDAELLQWLKEATSAI